MSEEGDRTQEILEKLKQQRDELRLKVHLGKAEARDEWEELEEKFSSLKERLLAAGGEATDAKGDISTAAKDLASELKKGYERIRAKL
jgi:chromosome segregation ATPase